MHLSRLAPLVAGALLLAACERATAPTQATLNADVLAVDPVALEFNATNGLPGAPFHIAGPGSRADAKGPAAPFPDSLKLTPAQQAQIQALRDAFEAANKADLDALKAIHDAAVTAIKAGKTRDEVRAILETAKPILERLAANLAALRAAIGAVLTPEQQAWIAAHRPSGPPGRP